MSGRRDSARPLVLLIAPPNSYRINSYVNAAHALGADIHIASQGRYSLSSAVAEGVHIDLHNTQDALHTLLQTAHDRPYAAVVATDDATVELASQLAQHLELPHNPPAAARLSRRKDLARARLWDAGLPVPKHQRIDIDAPLLQQVQPLAFPCVVKPLALSASRGVIRVDSLHDLILACERIRPLLAEAAIPMERHHVLLEEFIPGPELAVEGLLRQGEFRLLALFDKPDPLSGPFFEETYYITPSRQDAATQARICARVAAACEAYGLIEGAVHTEVRLHNGDAWILEVAARTIGGQCARLLRFHSGATLEQLVLAELLRLPCAHEHAGDAGGVLMIPIPRAGILRRVEGLLAAQQVPYIEEIEISVREGYELVPLPEGASYLGFIFARAPSPELAEQALRTAHAHLTIVTVPLWKMRAVMS